MLPKIIRKDATDADRWGPVNHRYYVFNPSILHDADIWARTMRILRAVVLHGRVKRRSTTNQFRSEMLVSSGSLRTTVILLSKTKATSFCSLRFYDIAVVDRERFPKAPAQKQVNPSAAHHQAVQSAIFLLKD